MIGDLFDSPWKILIVAVVLIVLFGSKKLPDAARSLGKSMRILKTEVQDLHGDDAEKAEKEKAAAALTAQPPSVRPCRTPPVISTSSCSNFIRAPRPYPARLRASAAATSAVVIPTPAGRPS